MLKLNQDKFSSSPLVHPSLIFKQKSWIARRAKNPFTSATTYLLYISKKTCIKQTQRWSVRQESCRSQSCCLPHLRSKPTDRDQTMFCVKLDMRDSNVLHFFLPLTNCFYFRNRLRRKKCQQFFDKNRTYRGKWGPGYQKTKEKPQAIRRKCEKN